MNGDGHNMAITLKIKNKRTGEIKEISPIDAQNYGLNPKDALDRLVAQTQLEEAAKGKPVGLSEAEAKNIRKEESTENILTTLENLYFKGGQTTGLAYADPNDPVLGREKGRVESIKASRGQNPQLNTYKRILESKRALLARAAGDVGNFNIVEQLLAGRGLPDEYSTPEEAFALFRESRNALQAGKSDRLTKIEGNYQKQLQGTRTENAGITYTPAGQNLPPQQPTAPVSQQNGQRGEGVLGMLGINIPGINDRPTGLREPNILGDILSPRAADIQRKTIRGENVGLEERVGAGGELARNVSYATGNPLLMGLGGAVGGATTPGASIGERAKSAAYEGAFGLGAGALGKVLKGTAGIISGGNKAKAVATRTKITNQLTKDLPTEKLQVEAVRIAQNLPATASKAEQELSTLTSKIKPTDLVEKIDFWGQAFKQSGELKDTASAKLYGALQRTAKKILKEEAPEILKAHQVLQKAAARRGLVTGALKKVIFPTAVGAGVGIPISIALQRILGGQRGQYGQ